MSHQLDSSEHCSKCHSEISGATDDVNWIILQTTGEQRSERRLFTGYPYGGEGATVFLKASRDPNQTFVTRICGHCRQIAAEEVEQRERNGQEEFSKATMEFEAREASRKPFWTKVHTAFGSLLVLLLVLTSAAWINEWEFAILLSLALLATLLSWIVAALIRSDSSSPPKQPSPVDRPQETKRQVRKFHAEAAQTYLSARHPGVTLLGDVPVVNSGAPGGQACAREEAWKSWDYSGYCLIYVTPVEFGPSCIRDIPLDEEDLLESWQRYSARNGNCTLLDYCLR